MSDDTPKEGNRKSTPVNIHIQSDIRDDLDYLTTKPPVTIMVESPKDPPNVDFGVNITTGSSLKQSSDSINELNDQMKPAFEFDDINQPIDVNKPRDTSNIFYVYEEPTEKLEPKQIIEQTLENQMKSEKDSQKSQMSYDTNQSSISEGDDKKDDDNENQGINVNRDNSSS